MKLSFRRKKQQDKIAQQYRLWVLNRWQLLLIEQRISECEQVIAQMGGAINEGTHHHHLWPVTVEQGDVPVSLENRGS